MFKSVCLPKTIFLFTLALFLNCQKDDTRDFDSTTKLDDELKALIDSRSQGFGLNFFVLPDSNDYEAIPQDPKNKLTDQKVALGKLLVHETATGGDAKVELVKNTFSCASCHPVASGFYSGNLQGIGEGGMGFGARGELRQINPSMPLDSVDILPIKVPTLLNLAYQEQMLWNGALGGTGINVEFIEQNIEQFPENQLEFQGIETQAIAGQTVHRLRIDADFIETQGYELMFDNAFPEITKASNRYSKKTAGLAIAAYNRTLLANQSPWQKWLKGETSSLSVKEKRGAKLFFGKANCVACHTGPALKTNTFHALGLNDIDAQNGIILNTDDFAKTKLGRGGFTGNPVDNYKFKVPNLYNLKDNPFYGHGGSFSTIKAIIEYKNKAIKQNSSVPNSDLDPAFVPLQLTDTEVDDLTMYITSALYDSNLERYVPDVVLSGNCFPNADSESKSDLNCN